MEVLDLVVVQVAFVDAIEALDVGVTLVLESRPVKGRRLLNGEAIGLGVMDGLGNGRGVKGDLLGNTAAKEGLDVSRDSSKHNSANAGERRLPDVDTSSTQALSLDDNGLGAELAAGHAGRAQAAAAAAEDEVVGLLDYGSHGGRPGRGQMPR